MEEVNGHGSTQANPLKLKCQANGALEKITIPLLRKEFHRSGQTQAEEEPDLETTPSMTSSRY